MGNGSPYSTRGEPARKADMTEIVPRPMTPAIRWGAVLAGVAVGISVQLALTLLGVATGLSTVEVTEGTTAGMDALLWAGLSMLVAAFFGGYVAARMSGFKRRADGVLHGAVSWAVTTILFVLLASSLGSSLVGGVFGNLGQMAQGTGNGNGNEVSPAVLLMRSQGARLEPEILRRLQQLLQAGDRDGSVQLLMSALNMEQQRAEAVVDQALILAGLPRSASPQGRATARSALHGAGNAAWVVFLAVALALVIGIGGGALGAAGSRRVSWGAAAPPRS